MGNRVCWVWQDWRLHTIPRMLQPLSISNNIFSLLGDQLLQYCQYKAACAKDAPFTWQTELIHLRCRRNIFLLSLPQVTQYHPLGNKPPAAYGPCPERTLGGRRLWQLRRRSLRSIYGVDNTADEVSGCNEAAHQGVVKFSPLGKKSSPPGVQ